MESPIMKTEDSLVAFLRFDVIARGSVTDVVRTCLEHWSKGERGRMAVYNDLSLIHI